MCLLLVTAGTANYAMYILFRATEIVRSMQAEAAHSSGKGSTDSELERPVSYAKNRESEGNEPLLDTVEHDDNEHEDEINYPIMGR